MSAVGGRGSKGARYMLERSCLLKYRTNIVVLYLIEPLSVSDCLWPRVNIEI